MLTSELRLVILPRHVKTPCLALQGPLLSITLITCITHECSYLCVYCPSLRPVAIYTGAAPYYNFSGAFTGPDVLKVQYLLNKLMHEFINV